MLFFQKFKRKNLISGISQTGECLEGGQKKSVLGGWAIIEIQATTAIVDTFIVESTAIVEQKFRKFRFFPKKIYAHLSSQYFEAQSYKRPILFSNKCRT